MERLHLTRTPTITSQVVDALDALRNDIHWTMREAEFVDLAQRVFPDVVGYLEEYNDILSETYYADKPRRTPDSKYTFDPFSWRFTLVKMFSDLVQTRPMFIDVDGAQYRLVREIGSTVHIDRIDQVVYELAPVTQHVEA